MAEVTEINDLRTLSGYRMLWDSLLCDTPRATFLHTFDWLENYWRHFGTDQHMRVLVVSAAGEMLGIVPLCVKRRAHRLGSVRVLTYPLDDWASFYSPIGKNQTAMMVLAMRHLALTRRDWDELDLPWIADTVDRGRTRRAMQLGGFVPRREAYRNSSTIDMQSAGTWDNYLAGLPRKVRHELRRKVRRVEEWGEVEFVRHRPDARRLGDGDPRWDLYDVCEQIASESWQATSTSGNTICHPQFSSFYRDSHAAAARLGMADLAVLRLAGRPVAFWLGYHHQGRVLGLRMGYRRDAAVSGVGTTLLARLIEDGFARGDEALNLGPGDERYKARLRSSVESSYRLRYTPPTAWKPQLLRASHWLRGAMAASVSPRTTQGQVIGNASV